MPSFSVLAFGNSMFFPVERVQGRCKLGRSLPTIDHPRMLRTTFFDCKFILITKPNAISECTPKCSDSSHNYSPFHPQGSVPYLITTMCQKAFVSREDLLAIMLCLEYSKTRIASQRMMGVFLQPIGLRDVMSHLPLNLL